jgi:hypothetical protein
VNNVSPDDKFAAADSTFTADGSSLYAARLLSDLYVVDGLK